MTAKEKAEELIDKYSFIEIAYYTSIWEVKQGASIAVEEIMDLMDGLKHCIKYDEKMNYWNNVLIEIEKHKS